MKRHIVGSSINYLMIPSDILEDPNLTPLEKMVLAYDDTNETPLTSDASCAECLGVEASQVASARDNLRDMGYNVETHREKDLTEDEYYV